jgi:hypothetical protein
MPSLFKTLNSATQPIRVKRFIRLIHRTTTQDAKATRIYVLSRIGYFG